MNWMVVPTLAIAFCLFRAGDLLWRRADARVAKIVLLGVAIILAIPACLYVAYYSHLFDNAAWFHQMRSLRFSELAAGGVGLGAGIIASIIRDGRLVSRPFLVFVLTIGVVGPYLKPLLAPLSASRLHDRWLGDVCLQSTDSSCGAASAATLLRASGFHTGEAEVARQCFTYLGGTENWYLARYFRRQGFGVRFIIDRSPAGAIPVPSIAGVKVGGLGHFIPIIAETATTYVTGDPLVGRQEWPKDTIRQRVAFTGFFMTVTAPH